MNWRETLGVTPQTGTPYTHNAHNAQKPVEPGNCADIADSAYRESEEKGPMLLEALADACRGLNITSADVEKALAPEDIEDWRYCERYLPGSESTNNGHSSPIGAETKR